MFAGLFTLHAVSTGGREAIRYSALRITHLGFFPVWVTLQPFGPVFVFRVVTALLPQRHTLRLDH